MESFQSIKFVNELGGNLSTGNSEIAQKLSEWGLFTRAHKMAQNLGHVLFAVSVTFIEKPKIRYWIQFSFHNVMHMISREKTSFDYYEATWDCRSHNPRE